MILDRIRIVFANDSHGMGLLPSKSIWSTLFPLDSIIQFVELGLWFPNRQWLLLPGFTAPRRVFFLSAETKTEPILAISSASRGKRLFG